MRTLKFDNFKIEIRTINSDSNYNLSVRLLDDKGLVKGTVLKENTSDTDILKFFFQEKKNKLSKDDYYKLRNTIYGVTDIYGKHIGDIREEYLTPLWNNGSIISLENPVNKATEYLSKIVKGWNWVALPNSLQEIEPKLVSILIKEK